MTHEQVEFEIEGLSCASCVGRAETALGAVSGVSRAEVNLATRRARVEGDGISASAISQALEEAGYPAVPETVRLRITGMSCASCVGRIEAALMQVPGVVSAQVNLADGTARVAALGADGRAIGAAIGQAGYKARSVADGAREDAPMGAEIATLRRNLWIAASLTLPIFLIEMGGHAVPAIHHFIARTVGLQNSWLIQFVLATLVLVGPGRMFVAKGFPALWRRAPDMNALVALGAGAAWLFSTVAVFRAQWLPDGAVAVYFEAAAVIVTLILLGRWLEARAKGRTGEAIRRLIGLQPKRARVERDGVVVDLPIEEITPGDLVQLRPGERIAVDGTVLSGTSFVDESMITGEPLAAQKEPGSPLVAGTVNGGGALVMQARAVGADTMLARIIAIVQEAQGARLPVQDLVNRITLWFVPAVMVVAVATVALWLLFGPTPALPFALVAGVSVLIIACPCAMGLATPMSVMVGTGRAAELGVLFRQGDALQALASVEVIGFDKTGTLTKGKPDLVRIEAVGGPEEMLGTVAALEAASEHPLAAAIVAAARAQGIPVRAADAVQIRAGYGLNGQVDGVDVVVGNLALLRAEGIDPGRFEAIADIWAQDAMTPVFVALDGAVAGLLGIADPLRPEAKHAIAQLQDMGVGVAMISGDVAATAQAVAAQLGINEVHAGILPEGKAEVVAQMRMTGRVGFVGDGINDAPALAVADIGIAIGTGTDVAVESADVVLMSGDPLGVVDAIRISRATLRNIRQNLGWAFGYNIVLIPVAAGVLFPFGGPLLSPALAAGAMALSSILVVGNALRLRWVKGHRR